jgi:hypothetical protein
VAASFERRGYPLLLTTATVTERAYLERLRDALPGGDVLFARLTAPAEVLRERIAEREPPDWVGLPRLLDATTALATSMATLPGVDLVLDSAANDVEQLVAAIHRRLLD